MALNWSLQHFTDTAANFTANNPTLLLGQLGIETNGLTTTPKFKVGDGTTAWNSLPYFYGGSLSAQDIANVLGVGNDTGGASLKMNTGTTYYGATNQAHIQNVSGLELHNSIANTLCNLTDAGLWKVDAVQYMPNLTGSRLLSLDANKYVVNETGTGILTLTSGVISYDTNTYLTTSAAALTYQPLDADLTSWAGVTRASGFDTFTATPSSANLSSLLTDKTGTGVNVFGTSPTFTTDITTPLIIGGSAVGSNITYKSTSGTGTTTAVAHTFTGGTNGGTTIATLYNNGNVNIGNYASPNNQRLVTIGQDTAYVSIGSMVGLTSYGAIYFGQSAPSSSNYGLIGDATNTIINAGTSGGAVGIYVNGGNRATFRDTTVVFNPTSASGAAPTLFTFTVPANTGQTASTEIPNFKVTGNTKTWANGGGATTIATQRWNHFTANTAATSGGGSLTITNSYGAYFEKAVASGVTISNNYSLGTDGAISLGGAIAFGTTTVLASSSTTAQLASSGGWTQVITYTNGANRLQIDGLTSSGATNAFTFSPASNTGQTASTEINGYLYNSYTRTWANGGGATTIATQRERWKKTVTYATSGGGSLTITDAFTEYIESATASGVTITNNWSIGTTGGIKVNATANTVLGNAALATNATTGFLHVPSCAGTPTGTPTLYTGMIPICADSTNNKLYIYSGGAWVALN